MNEPIDWSEANAPRSSRFNDTYFSAEDGLAETREVFLKGCGLPEAWAGRTHFTIGELGFGTGLNILAALQLWRSAPPSPDARLHLFSIEAYPMSQSDAVRALGHWPELADLSAPLLANWPDGRRGGRRIVWADLGATLDLQIAEAADALSGWTGHADAWFLDGFAPSRNPEMWRDEVLGLLAQRSRPGARMASFTVAGAVRRGLEAVGLAVERRPGFGRKKQRLEVRVPGAFSADPGPPRIAILGAGIAGAALRRAFVGLGVTAEVFDESGAGAGASGNPSALMTPRIDAGLGPNALLHAQAFAHACTLYRRETPEAVLAEGALQLAANARDGARFERIATWDGFADGALARLSGPEAARSLNETAAAEALSFRDAMVLEPKAVLDVWLGDAVRKVCVQKLERFGSCWRLLDDSGAEIAQADVVLIALANASGGFTNLPLRSVRGQISLVARAFTGKPAAWGGYAIPTRNGLLYGATHDRADLSCEIRDEDHARNLASLVQGRPDLAARLADAARTGRASIRAATPDHLPLAGAVPSQDDLYILAGLGGRGFTLAPILAEQIAAEVLGLGGPLPRSLAALTDPGRYVKAV